jgi:release factor glutamine methyltransferase
LDAELLISSGLGLKRIDLYLKFEQPLKEDELQKLREMVKRRSQGEPVAYILGEKDFFGESFFVNSSVLIPRPETETLVETALDWLTKNPKEEIGILDLGCGSGCIGLSLLKKIPHARLLAVDISSEALSVAQKNAERLQVSDRAQWLCEDAFNHAQVKNKIQSFFNGGIDLLVANPPYIASDDVEVENHVKTFEPHIALFSENAGLKHLQEWTKHYAPLLRAPGLMLMEMGYTQGPTLQKAVQELNFFSKVEITKDLSGKDRIIRGELHG